MNIGTAATIAAFALAALPGIIVLEIFEFGRTRIRDRNAARALAVYLILSLVAWVAAALVLGADDRLGSVIDLASRTKPGPGQGAELVNAYIALSWRLLVLAVVLGLTLRWLSSALGKYAFETIEKVRLEPDPELTLAARIAVGLVSMGFAWDGLFIRLKHTRKVQIVHVRFRDGSEAYGVFAGGGRADYQADGQGLVLDAELIEHEGGLVQVLNSNGMYIAPEAIASISFIDDPSPSLPSGQLQLINGD